MVDENEVKEVLELIRPSLIADGGDVELIEVREDGTVVVELQGSCKGCPLSSLTLANGIERILKERVLGVTAVVPNDMEDFDFSTLPNVVMVGGEDEEEAAE